MNEQDMYNQRMLHMMQQMPQHGEEGYNDVVAQVDFKMSEHPNPKKARRKNIKNAIKALQPMKRSWFSPRRYWFGGKFAISKPYQCVVDGTNCMNADYGDLFDQYFRDPQTMQLKPFKAWSGVIPGTGRQLQGTYCPQHMMLYHKLMEWIELEEAEADPNFFQRMAKKGVAFVPVKRQAKSEPENPLIVKWTPVFIEAQKDGIQIVHYTNPITGENDITMLVFDNRTLASTAPTGTVLKSMDMAQYHQVIEQMGKQQ